MTTFKLIQKVGEGSYSRVYKAISEQSQRTLAVKIISFKDAPLDYVSSRELQILKEVNHPNIAKLLDCIVSKSSIYLVFEYYSMNLNQFYRSYQTQHNRNLEEAQVRHIMVQLCSALAYLHSLHIMHRDVKPQNIMIDPATLNIKLIDFGFAKKVNDDPMTAYMVTRWYRPLEVVIGLRYDHRIDIFAAALIYLELTHGKQILQSISNMDQLHKLLTLIGYPSQNTREYATLQKLGVENQSKGPTISDFVAKLPQSTRNTVSAMLSNSAADRPPIDSLLQILVSTQSSQPIQSAPVVRENRRRARSSAAGLSLAKHFSKQKRNVIRSQVLQL